jgi:hypothetical protein
MRAERLLGYNFNALLCHLNICSYDSLARLTSVRVGTITSSCLVLTNAAAKGWRTPMLQHFVLSTENRACCRMIFKSAYSQESRTKKIDQPPNAVQGSFANLVWWLKPSILFDAQPRISKACREPLNAPAEYPHSHRVAAVRLPRQKVKLDVL